MRTSFKMAPYSTSGNRIPNSHRKILALISLSLMDFLELADKKRVPPDQGQISAQQSACANCSKTRTRSSGDSMPACRWRLLDKISSWVAEPVTELQCFRCCPCNFIHPLSRIILFFLLVFFAAKSEQKQPKLFGLRHSRIFSRMHDLVHSVKTTTILQLSTKRQKGHLTTFKIV